MGFLGIPCVISKGFKPLIGNIWVFGGHSLMILGFSRPFIGNIWGFFWVPLGILCFFGSPADDFPFLGSFVGSSWGALGHPMAIPLFFGGLPMVILGPWTRGGTETS